MKIIIPTSSLSDALRKVLTVGSTRSPIPVLNNVLLQAKDNRLSLSTTDMDVSITTDVNVVVERNGETTLPAKKFGQIVGTLPNGDVTLDTNPELITTITCKNAMFKVSGLSPSDFPRRPEVDGDQKFVFDKIELLKTLRKIGYAVSTDQTRVVLNGILLSVRGGNITAVATDGRRLALVEKITDGSVQLADGDVILPTKVVHELQKLLDGDGQVTVKISSSFSQFNTGDTTITSKLIDGTYPNYRQVIPSSFKNSVVLPREAFFEVLNRVSIVVSESGSAIRFVLKEDSVTLSASTAEIGESEESLPVSYQGEPVNISFNPAFLKEPLKNLDCDEFTLRFNDEFKPVVLLGDQGFLYVIMPMRN